MLGLGAQVDEDDSDSLLGTLYVGVGASTWLTLVAGRSSSPAERADYRSEHVGRLVSITASTMSASPWKPSAGEIRARSRRKTGAARSTSIATDGASGSATRRAISKFRSR